MRIKRFHLTIIVALLIGILSPWAAAQSLTSGDINGPVSDPSGAAIPNATAALKNNQTGATETRTASPQGGYHFPLLNPGSYTLTVSAKGFQSQDQTVTVSVGQGTAANIKLALATATQTVEVTAQAGVLQTDNGNVSTTLSSQQISSMPNPGNDMSYYVQTAPGATMNTQAGYGNSATFGISATSNLFTVDGMNENDPFLNLNNSGATNLLLGTNDVETATVVNNGYSGEYGELAGANVNYVTKSGTNNVHGNAEYFWNGSTLNANNWFNNHTSPVTPRPFDNANQWAAAVGGPIVKDKTFFFLNTEGLRLVIPTSTPVNVPSPAFQAATLANLASNGNAAEIPFYNQILSIYNNAPGFSRAADVGLGCDGGITLAGGVPCALQFQSNASNLTTEWILTARVDQIIGGKDRVFVHFRTDHGLQATITDPLTPVLNAQSTQPQYEGQLQWNHTVGTNAANQLIAAGSWYSAIFKPPSLTAAISLIPYQLTFGGGEFATPGSAFYSTWPQGRNVTQYQVADDYSWQRGNHNLKFGVNFRRNDITDYTPGGFFTTIPNATFSSEASFFNGTVDTFQQAFAVRPTQPLALYALGLYAQDQWAIGPNLKLTLALRAEHNSNPVCQTNCIARLANSFANISHDPNEPYNQAIDSGLHQALPNYQNIGWGPRLGFAWQPMGRETTVIRGGGGFFYDVFPGTVTSNFATNSPVKNTFISSGLQLAPGLPGSAQTATTVANSAFVAGFNNGLNISQIEAGTGGALFSPPAFFNAAHNIHYPQYQEWNLEIQQALGSTMSLSVNYVGNHGIYLALANPILNAFCNSGPVPFNPAPTAAPCTGALGISSFAGLPAQPVDPRFSTVTEASNPGVSNYNGVTVQFTRKFASLQVGANYTYSHALDDISNGGFLPFNFNTNTAILSPQSPLQFRQFNYGNADYDARQQFALNWVYNTPKMKGWTGLLANWTFAGTVFARTGLPFTVIDGGTTGVLGAITMVRRSAFLFLPTRPLGRCRADPPLPPRPALLTHSSRRRSFPVNPLLATSGAIRCTDPRSRVLT